MLIEIVSKINYFLLSLFNLDMLSPVLETSNITPSVYSVHALTLLSEVNVFQCTKSWNIGTVLQKDL